MATPAVTVLLPFRDAAATIEEALASTLAAADGVTLELLAIDDGSRDEGAQLVRSLAAVDPRVRVVESGGVGIPRALTRGLEEARGAWIARMDADDVALRGRFAAQLRALETDARLGAVGARVEAFADDGPIGEGLACYVAWQNALVTPEDHARDLFVEAPLCHPSVMLRRRALEEVGGWRETSWAEDYDLWLRLDAAGWRLAKVPEVLLRWRHHARRATFTDARYAPESFLRARAAFLAPRLRDLGARRLAVWGAGGTGKRLARALEAHDVFASRFVDIDPRKIGRTRRGAAVVDSDQIAPERDFVVVAVGARGARDIVRAALTSRGFVELRDFVCAA